MTNINRKERIWEIDFLRGFLILVMIYMHTIFDLQYSYGMNLNYGGGVHGIIVNIGGALFIMVSGISTAFSRSNVKRGFIVLGVALAITIATFLYNPEFVIVFGILHFMGICMLVSPILKKIPTIGLFILSAVLASTAFILPYIKVDHNYLFMFGLYTSDFTSSDYYPLLPYSWAFLFGMGLSRILYKEKKSIIPFPLKSTFVNFIGRNSLYVYIVHQPVILIILYVIMNRLK
ncbi:MAG: hypothetical protein BWY74_02078 [Firmicutes bacterium ADurb.Bin419]|nr:MAG: hypothetical protein BWY74_02078 [Firmicutes bacterium ADurb.Bin419]